MIRSALALTAALATAATITVAPPQGSGMASTIVADLTTQIGPQLDGSAREAGAPDWTVAHLKALGLANVHIDTPRKSPAARR